MTRTKKLQNAIDAGLDINDNRRGFNLFDIAFRISDEEMMKFFIDNGADVNNNPGGIVPLCKMCETNNEDMVKKLIIAGANVNSINSVCETPLSLSSNNVKITKLLLDAGAKPRDKSLIKNAIRRGDIHMIKILLKYYVKSNDIGWIVRLDISETARLFTDKFALAYFNGRLVRK